MPTLNPDNGREWKVDRRRDRESGSRPYSRRTRLLPLSTFSALLLYSPSANRDSRDLRTCDQQPSTALTQRQPSFATAVVCNQL